MTSDDARRRRATLDISALMTVPFSFAGGIVALTGQDLHINVSAAVGFISLFGVAVMSVIPAFSG
jgi:Cu/Ag efflux pump CusA